MATKTYTTAIDPIEYTSSGSKVAWEYEKNSSTRYLNPYPKSVLDTHKGSTELLGELLLKKHRKEGVKELSFYGSSGVVPKGTEGDTDILVLVDNVPALVEELKGKYKGLVKDYSSLGDRRPEFFSYRLDGLNVVLTVSEEMYEKSLRAQVLVEELKLQTKKERVLMFDYVFDGPSKSFTDEDFTKVILKEKELKDFLPYDSSSSSSLYKGAVPF